VIKRVRYTSFDDCEKCEGGDPKCKECKERSWYEYEKYLDEKCEDALAEMRGEEQ